MLLEDSEIEMALAGGPWKREGDAIMREAQCRDFAEAIERVREIARAAEREGHHPDILIHSYNRLRLTLSTHSEAGITQADIAMAGQLDALLP